MVSFTYRAAWFETIMVRLGLDLKTNALGACLFILVTDNGTEFHDFVRMAEPMVVGVGFIGGGLLFREGA